MATNVNTMIYDKQVDRAAMIRLYEKRVNGKIEIIVDGHAIRVDDMIKKAQLTGKGFDSFRDALEKEIQKTYKEAYTVSSRSLLDLVSDQVSYTFQTLETALGKIWNTSKPQRRIAEEIVLQRPLYKNVTLNSGWAGVSISERKRLEQVIRKGLAEGKSNAEIALEVRKGNTFNISRNQSKALVTTAITSVHAQVDQEVYKANEKALQGWQYVAVLDSRTTPICAFRDGTVYPIGDYDHLPPAHYNCRSTTIPVVKSWDDLSKLEGINQIRKRNLLGLTPKQIQFYDGLTPLKESYNEWLLRQTPEVQLRHIGDIQKLELFRSGQLSYDKFIGPDGASLGIKELRRLTDSGYALPGDTRRFALAKEKLDALKLGASYPDDFINDANLKKALKEYYILQAGELDGNLSLINYRGKLLFNKKATKARVLNTPPSEDNLIFNPITGRYEDNRIYQPSQSTYENALRLVRESEKLLPRDKDFILNFVNDLEDTMGLNERSVIADNLRITFGRARENKTPWVNFKAVSTAQMNFDVMNISDYMETQLRKDSDLLKKLLLDNYIDPVLGPTQLQQLHDEFFKNIYARNDWEDKIAPKIARELKGLIDTKIPIKLRARINSTDIDAFYLRFAHRLAMADMPDRDQFAVSIGRDLYNMANYRGSRNEWYRLGVKLLDDADDKGFFKLESYDGIRKRRMKSRLSGQYFGPYYDTVSVNLRIIDPRIQEYAKLQRKVDAGLRVSIVNPKNKLVIREGYKTYWIDRGILGMYDTRIPITSTHSFSDFPEDLVDANMVTALNWAAESQYKIDEDFYDFIYKLLYFEDDKGRAKYFNDLNTYREYIVSRGDAYERFKAMEWLRANKYNFSNTPFLDHRARIYERGLIGPQSGETFRPFLSTSFERNFSEEAYYNLQDQIGSFLGGLSDYFEGRYNSLSFSGRQKIAEKWRDEMVKIGKHMLNKKPNDLRAILESEFVQMVDGEEQGKLFRFALEMAKIDNFLRSRVPYQIKGRAVKHIGRDELDINQALKYAIETKEPKNISIEDITFYGESNDFSFDNLPKNDLQRIESADLSAPILVEKLDNGKLEWIDGWHRVMRAKQLGIKKLPARILEQSETDQFIKRKVTGAPLEVDKYLYTKASLANLKDYKTALALEQDASSSGAQIIALTTRNKQLAELSNVIPTNQKKRLYDEIAAATFNDPRFRQLNLKLGLTEKDLRKAAKAQNMVTFYGAGERTGIMNVEGKLAKALSKEDGVLVVKAADRDKVLNEISARMARYEQVDPELYLELKALRQDVKDIFNKGLDPGDDILDQLYFLEPGTRELVEKLSGAYIKTVTPDDFKQIAQIMSENLREQVPVLKDFTKFFGRLAEDFLINAKPSDSLTDFSDIIAQKIAGTRQGKPPSFLERLPWYKPNSPLSNIFFGIQQKKLPKKWTSVPWVNFDGKTIEQNFTQTFEERLRYQDKDGRWVTNILQINQKTDPTWWEEFTNKADTINDIADVSKARTAFAVNGNHSNDATLVKRFHIWGYKNGVPTSTIHDAFFTNAVDMLKARTALRKMYSDSLKNNVIKMTLDEMRKRGLPKNLYDKYMNEAIELGLIPIVGRSRIGGKILTDTDILTSDDILKEIPESFFEDVGWYGVG